MNNNWTKKEAPLKEAPFLGLTGMGGGVNSLMWAGAGQEIFDLYSFGLQASNWPANPSHNMGVLGINYTQGFKNSPVQVSGDWYKLWQGGLCMGGGYPISGMTVGGAKDEIGSFWVWGSNDYGNLGLNQSQPLPNNTNRRSSPAQIPGTDWANASISSFSLATKTDGSLWAWGNNEHGNLGLNNKDVHYSSPTQVPGTWSGDPFTLVASAPSLGFQSFAIKANGSLWAWGSNTYGSLGQNNKTNYSSPRQIPGTDWKQVMNGSSTLAGATKTNGELWMWGNGQGGGLAQNSRTKYSSPKQVPGTWKQTACGGYTSGVYGIKTDGTLWSWGYNHEGVLGQGQEPAIRNSLSSPTQIGARTDWAYIDSSQGNGKSIKAITTDGKLWVWGKNYGDYSLGVGPGMNGSAFSSPTQVANITTNWGTGSAYDTDYAWTMAGVWGAGFVLRQR